MPSTSATMLTPNVLCSGVCLKSLFSTTLGMASRLSSIVSRVPPRSEWLLTSAISGITLSLTRSAIFLTRPSSPSRLT